MSMVEVIVCFSISCFSPSYVPILVDFLLKNLIKENVQCREIRKKIKIASEELNDISAVDEFARYTRKNRELTKLRAELKSADSTDSFKFIKLRLFLQAVLYILAGLICIITLYRYWSSSLIKFPSSWFYPINFLMSWPLKYEEDEGRVSAFFMLIVVAYFSRMVTAVTPW